MSAGGAPSAAVGSDIVAVVQRLSRRVALLRGHDGWSAATWWPLCSGLRGVSRCSGATTDDDGSDRDD